MSKIALEKYNHKKLMWLHDSLKFIGIFVALFLIFRFVIGISVVDGNSMEPTLQDGDIVIYLRAVPQYDLGDVVCVWVPSGNYYVKRVVALGGDTVSIADGALLSDNADFSDTFSYGVTEEEEGAVLYPYLVREGNYFVLGDNREVSVDSRTFGEVSKRQVRGKIIFYIRGWQWHRMRG